MRKRHNKEDLQRIIWVYTEGKTEKTYLSKLRTRSGKRTKVKVTQINKNKLEFIKKIIATRDDNEGNNNFKEKDVIWAVMDIDMEGRESRNKLKQAFELAKKEGIELAYSNNSFEIWPLLHFEDVKINQKMGNKDLEDKLQKHLDGKYKKDGSLVFDFLENKDYEQASSRAEQLLGRHTKNNTDPIKANPSTTIHKLIKIIKHR